MLNKEICRRCIDQLCPGAPWTEHDDGLWRAGEVDCAEYVRDPDDIPFGQTRGSFIRTNDAIPACCPFAAEQVVPGGE